MQPIVIQGAMDIELQYYLEVLSDTNVKTIGNHVFYHGLFQDYPIIIAKTDIGSINCSVSTTLAASDFFPLLIINQGIAGAHRNDLHVKDIVVGDSVVSINSFEKPLAKEGVSYHEWTPSKFFSSHAPLQAHHDLVALFDKSPYADGSKVVGKLGCGDVWNREWEFITWLNRTLGSACEDMESMASYKVAEEFGVPVIGLRIISNNELTEEEYDPEVAILLQKFIVDQLPKLIDWAKARE